MKEKTGFARKFFRIIVQREFICECDSKVFHGAAEAAIPPMQSFGASHFNAGLSAPALSCLKLRP